MVVYDKQIPGIKFINTLATNINGSQLAKMKKYCYMPLNLIYFIISKIIKILLKCYI